MSHPSVCPKCKYNRPIFLSYCPHCRDLNPKEKENARKEINSKFDSILKDTKQKEQQNPNMKKTNKLKGLQGARNSKARWTKGAKTKSSKSKRKIKSRV